MTRAARSYSNLLRSLPEYRTGVVVFGMSAGQTAGQGGAARRGGDPVSLLLDPGEDPLVSTV
jgi:hypothetical protein